MDRAETIACLTRNITWLRKTHRFSRKKMAGLLGIRPSTLRQLEKGVLPQQLDIELLFRVQEHFGISPQDLLEHDLA